MNTFLKTASILSFAFAAEIVAESENISLRGANNEEEWFTISTTPSEYFQIKAGPGDFLLDDETHLGANNDKQTWVDGHNTRRQKYHTQFGGASKYTSLAWDDSLSQDVMTWLKTLAKSKCANYHHDPNTKYGENLAVLYTKGRKSTSPELIMKAWVEEEYYDPTLPFSDYQGKDRGHMTQCLWRPSSYVGCAQIDGPDTGDDACIIYGCRYAKAGNCDMKQFMSPPATWVDAIMQDDSLCTPNCPPDLKEVSKDVCVPPSAIDDIASKSAMEE